MEDGDGEVLCVGDWYAYCKASLICSWNHWSFLSHQKNLNFDMHFVTSNLSYCGFKSGVCGQHEPVSHSPVIIIIIIWRVLMKQTCMWASPTARLMGLFDHLFMSVWSIRVSMTEISQIYSNILNDRFSQYTRRYVFMIYIILLFSFSSDFLSNQMLWIFRSYHGPSHMILEFKTTVCHQ